MDKLDKQIAKHQVESIVLSHATALVDVANKSTIPANDLNVDRDGDRVACGRHHIFRNNLRGQ